MECIYTEPFTKITFASGGKANGKIQSASRTKTIDLAQTVCVCATALPPLLTLYIPIYIYNRAAEVLITALESN